MIQIILTTLSIILLTWSHVQIPFMVSLFGYLAIMGIYCAGIFYFVLQVYAMTGRLANLGTDGDASDPIAIGFTTEED